MELNPEVNFNDFTSSITLKMICATSQHFVYGQNSSNDREEESSKEAIHEFTINIYKKH